MGRRVSTQRRLAIGYRSVMALLTAMAVTFVLVPDGQAATPTDKGATTGGEGLLTTTTTDTSLKLTAVEEPEPDFEKREIPERRLDVQLIAEDMGLSYEETEGILEMQDKQTRALQAWVDENRDNYGGARFGEGKLAGELTVLVKDVTKADSSVFPGVVRFEEVLLNEAEQHAALQEAETGRIGVVDATIDPATGEVTIKPGSPGSELLGCDNDGRAEAGRFGAFRSYTNKPYDEISSYSGCSAGNYNLCGTAFAVRQGSQHGVLSAGHCGDLGPAKYLSISLALNGQQQIQSMSVLDRDTWEFSSNYDYVFYRERYENTRVYGLIYQSGQIWFDVTGHSGVYPVNTSVCAKLSATAFYTTHQQAVKCGKIDDSSNGGSEFHDAHFFSVDWNGTGCSSTPRHGDSGSPVYRPYGTLDAIAYGIVSAGTDCIHSYNGKIAHILSDGSLNMHYSSNGTG